MMHSIIPIISILKKYNKNYLKKDLIAGLTVGVILIPQGIAYALIAGMPPIYGLYSALVPQLLYAVFGTSQRIAVGPVATDSLIVAAGVAVMASAGSDHYIALVLLLTLMTGLIQFLLGIGRLGFIVNFLSKPVISGFSSAAAVIIAINQLKYISGIDLPKSNQIHVILLAIFQNFSQYQIQTLFFGLGTIAILYFLKKIKSKLPGPLLVVVVGTLLMMYYHDVFKDVLVIQSIPVGLPKFSMVTFNWNDITRLFPIALTLAIIGFLETISIGKALEKSTDEMMIQPNKELVALGMMNMVGSFFNSFVTTASFSRSAVNNEAGAQTSIASFFSVFLIALVLLFLTPYFYYLPYAVLGGIIAFSVWKLVDVKEAVRLWQLDRTDFWMLVVTFFCTLILGVKEGIVIGVVLSLVMLVARTTKPHVAILGKIPGTNIYRNIERFKEVEVDEDILILRFDARLYFANSNYFCEILQKQTQLKGVNLKLIVLDCEAVNGVDSTAIQMLLTTVEFYKEKGIQIYFTNIKGPVRDMFTKSGLVQKMGVNKFFINNYEAVAFYKTGDLDNLKKHKNYIHQSNF